MEIVDEWAGHYFDPAENSDKIWAVSWTDTGDYLAVWGRRGNRKYQSQTKNFGSAAAARLEFFKMVRQKEAKGYRKVPFENAVCGSIPSFRRLQSATLEPGTGKITRGSLLGRIRTLTERVRTGFEPDTMLVEFNQLKAATGLLVEYAGRLKSRSAPSKTEVETETAAETEKDIPPDVLEAGLEALSGMLRQALLA